MAYTVPDTEVQADDLTQLHQHMQGILGGYQQTADAAQQKLASGLTDLSSHAQGIVQGYQDNAQAALQSGLTDLQDHAQSVVKNFSQPQRSQGVTDLAPPSVQPAAARPQQTTGQDARDTTAAPASASAPVDPNDLHAYARSAAAKAGVDPDIFERQIQQESGFRVDAGSPAGAQGIAQFMPETAKGMGVDVTNPQSSLDGAARLMRQNLDRYNGDYSKALAAYNAGASAVDKYNGVPPYEETQRYVSTILGDKKPVTSAPSPRNPDRTPDPNDPDPAWLTAAKAQLGKPYIWGSGSGAGGRGTRDIDPATGQPNGFDCSGFVSYIYQTAFGVNLPAQTASAYAATTHIDQADARPGDIVEFNMDSNDPHEQHIAIYLGGNKVIQAGGIERNVNIGAVDQFGPGTFQFRRADGADTGTANHAAANHVADLASHPLAKSPVAPATTMGAMQPADGVTDLQSSDFGGISAPFQQPAQAAAPQQTTGQDRRDSFSPPQAPQADDLSTHVRDVLASNGWKPAAIDQVLDRVDLHSVAGFAGNRQTLGDTGQDTAGGRLRINFYGRDAGDVPSDDTILHEAHHAADQLNINVTSQLTPRDSDHLAPAVDDLNTLRQFAATSGNRDLFDAANQALYDSRQDPAHLNHSLGAAASVVGVPEWYRSRYFNYQQGVPDQAPGAAPSPPVAVGNRSQGQDTSPQAMASQANAASLTQADRDRQANTPPGDTFVPNVWPPGSATPPEGYTAPQDDGGWQGALGRAKDQVTGAVGQAASNLGASVRDTLNADPNAPVAPVPPGAQTTQGQDRRDNPPLRAPDPRNGMLGSFATSDGQRTQNTDELGHVLDGVQSPQTGDGWIDGAGTAMSAIGSVASPITDTLGKVIQPFTPQHNLAVDWSGKDTQADNYDAAGERELADINLRIHNGDASPDDYRRAADLTDKLNAQTGNTTAQVGVPYSQKVQDAAASNPDRTNAYETGLNLASVIPSVALSVESAPVLAKAVAEVLQPGTNIGGVLHAAKEFVSGPAFESVAPVVEKAFSDYGIRMADTAAERLRQIAQLDDSGQRNIVERVGSFLSDLNRTGEYADNTPKYNTNPDGSAVPAAQSWGSRVADATMRALDDASPPSIAHASERLPEGLAGDAAIGDTTGAAPAAAQKPAPAIGRVSEDGSGAASAPAQNLYQRLQAVPFLTADDAAAALGSKQMPQYLDGVVAFLTEQRAKVSAGELTPRDVTKAWLLTVSSMLSGANDTKNVAKRMAGYMDLPAEASSLRAGKSVIRPEDTTAAWMLTPEGRATLDSFETGNPSPEALDALERLRKKAGFGQPMMRTDFLQTVKGEKPGDPPQLYNWFSRIPTVTGALNAAAKAGDWRAFDAALTDLRGISSNKTGFIKQLLGLGNTVTLDSNEINWWLTGVPDAKKITDPSLAAITDAISRATKASGVPAYMKGQITARFAQLRDMGYGADVPEDLYNHVMHHWLWDTIKDSETTHKTLYDAQRNAQIIQPYARTLGGAVAGGAAGNATTPDDASPLERGGRIAAGALGGAALGSSPEWAEPALGGALKVADRISPPSIAHAAERDIPLPRDSGLILPNAKRAPGEDLVLPGARTADDLTQIVGPRGEALSTIAHNDKGTGVAVSEAGAPSVGEPSADALKRMPNLNYMAKGMPDVQASLQRAAEANPQMMDDVRRGVISHQELAESLAPKLGMTSEQFLKSKAGKAYNAEELLTLRSAVVTQQARSVELAERINTKGVGTMSPEDKVEAITQLVDSARLQAVARGGAAEAGRALNQQKIIITREMASAITGANETKAAKAMADAANAKLARLATRTEANTKLAAEKQAAVEAARKVASERKAQQAADAATARATKATDAVAAKQAAADAKLSTTADKISDAYDQLAAYKAMSLEEKNSDLLANLVTKREAAAKVPDAPEALLKALQDELAAEKGIFKGSKTAWEDMAFNAAKKAETNKAKGPLPVALGGSDDSLGSGTTAWLNQQKKAATQEKLIAERRSTAAYATTKRVTERQRQTAERLLESLGGKEITDDVLAQWAKVQTGGDPLETARFLQSLQKVSMWDRVGILRYSAMLSATTTHLANTVGNVVNVGLDVALKPAAVGLDAARVAMFGGDRQRYMAEVGPQLHYMGVGAAGGLQQALVMLKTGINPMDVSKFESGKMGVRAGFQSGNKIVDAVAEMPLRALGAADLVFRGAATSGAAGAIATRRALQEGYTGAAAVQRTSDIMQSLHEFPDIVVQAEKEGARAVLQESNRFASGITQFGAGGGGWNGSARIARELILPFVKTPANVAKQGIEMTPLGLLKVRDAAKAGDYGSAADSGARVAFGSAVIAGTAALAANGLVTGMYPADPKDRDTLPPGWQPWSFRFPDNKGGFTYLEFSKAGPVAIPFAIGAVVGNARREGAVPDAATMVSSMGRFMVDQTFLQGLSTIMDAVKDPDRYAENLTEQIATSFVPYAGLSRQITRAVDMADRDPKGAIEALLALTPVTAGQVPRKQDALGRDIHSTALGDSAIDFPWKPSGLTAVAGAFASPVKYSHSNAEPVLDAFRDVGMGIPSAPSEITIANYPAMALNRAEQAQYQKVFGEALQRSVESQLQSAAWVNYSPYERKYVLGILTRAAHSTAETTIASAMEPGDLRSRMEAGATKKQAITALPPP